MPAFEIKLDLERLEILDGSDAPLCAGVWFRYEDLSFPHPEWTDFVGAVLSTTSTAMQQIVDGENEGFTDFFEGSYFVGYRILSRSDWTLHVEANEEVSDEVIRNIWIGVLNVRDILSETLQAADATLRECARRGIKGFGVDVLGRTRSDLSATLSQIEAR